MSIPPTGACVIPSVQVGHQLWPFCPKELSFVFNIPLHQGLEVKIVHGINPDVNARWVGFHWDGNVRNSTTVTQQQILRLAEGMASLGLSFSNS